MAGEKKFAPAYDINLEASTNYSIEELWRFWLASVEDFNAVEVANDQTAYDFSTGIGTEERLDIISRAQRKLVDALLETPSASFQDSVTKLKLWRSIIVPEGADVEDCSPTDQLGVLAVDELIRLMEK